MEELHIDGLAGKAYTLEAYAKALKKRVQLVIWRMLQSPACQMYLLIILINQIYHHFHHHIFLFGAAFGNHQR